MKFKKSKSDKRYFTQYVKVDGKPQHGSIIYTVAFGFIKLIENNPPHNDYWDGIRQSNKRRVTVGKFGYEDKPIYKLFLCEWDSYYEEPPMGKYIDLKIYNGGVNVITATRVIGEISQHAIWVKENMKFSEEEVLGVSFPGQAGITKVENLCNRIYKDGYPKILVKGSCGHYH